MAIQHERQFLITADGLSAWTPVPSGLTKVWIGYKAGASGTVTPKASHRPDDADAIFPVVNGGVEISATENNVFDVSGMAFVAFDVSGISGEIEITFTSAEPAA